MKPINNKTKRMLEVEAELGESIELYLHRRFVDENADLHDIAHDTGVAYRNILEWLELSGIYSRRLGICQTVCKKSKNN